MSKILIADDDKNINMLIQSLLKNENYEIVTAFDGKEALKKLDVEKVDMVITDIMMPNINGWELCK
ncbi:response regulator [Clostridium sp. JN-1]|uniref:response regulator n=1 Tax=Clostridium sp. JN-1 TaxID=2483110 RepID=UPI000F0B5A07|nr:response regulator [Clostridium sp. JN-1]